MKLILRYMNKKDRIISAIIMIVVVIQVLLETRIPALMMSCSGRTESIPGCTGASSKMPENEWLKG